VCEGQFKNVKQKSVLVLTQKRYYNEYYYDLIFNFMNMKMSVESLAQFLCHHLFKMAIC